MQKTTPCLYNAFVIKQDRGDTMIVMKLDDWLTDYRRLMELEGRLEDQ